MHRVRVVVIVVGWLLFFFYLLLFRCCCCSSTSPPERDQLQSDKTDLKYMAHITYSTLKPTQWNSQQLKMLLFICTLYVVYVRVSIFSFFISIPRSHRINYVCMHTCMRSLSQQAISSIVIHSTNCPSLVIVWHIY